MNNDLCEGEQRAPSPLRKQTGMVLGVFSSYQVVVICRVSFSEYYISTDLGAFGVDLIVQKKTVYVSFFWQDIIVDWGTEMPYIACGEGVSDYNLHVFLLFCVVHDHDMCRSCRGGRAGAGPREQAAGPRLVLHEVNAPHQGDLAYQARRRLVPAKDLKRRRVAGARQVRMYFSSKM